jgi:hypothetical protein
LSLNHFEYRVSVFPKVFEKEELELVRNESLKLSADLEGDIAKIFKL